MATETWLRVVIYRAQDPADENAIAYMKDSTARVLDMLESKPGFRLGYWGLDPDEGTMAAVTYWNSLAAIESATGDLTQLHEDRAKHGVEIVSTRNVELFTVPAIGMWGADDEEDQAPKHRRRWLR